MKLFTPDFGLVFWMFVSVAILLFVLFKWVWPVILKTLAKRADLIDKGVEFAKQAQAQLQNAELESTRVINEGRKEQADIIREAESIKAQIIQKAHVEAEIEAKKIIDAAKLTIEQERKELQKNYSEDVSKFAIAISEKILKYKLEDIDQQTDLIDRLITQSESKN